jgi:cysteinyl-tRNA synthetase
MDFLMVKILLFGIVGSIIGNPVIAIILLLAIAIVGFIHLKLSTFICYSFLAIVFLWSFVKDSEDASARAKKEPVTYSNDSKNKVPNARDIKTYENSIEQNIENDINADPSVQNLNQLLNNSDNLSPSDKQKLEQMREKRIKQIMDGKGKAIIDDYNRNNPASIISHQNKQPETSSNQQIVIEEKKQPTSNEKFIGILK